MKLCPKCLVILALAALVLFLVWRQYGNQLTTKAASMAAKGA